LLASSIKNIAVYSKDMVELGKVKDLEFDPSEMNVTYIIVEFEREAAKNVMDKRIELTHATGKIPPALIESIEDAVTLKSTFTQLKGALKDQTNT
jgi:sporulation protein YlmC with PRC-barrel domain